MIALVRDAMLEHQSLCGALKKIAMTGGLLASKTTAPSEIPPLFWTHVEDTVGAWHDGKTEFIE